MNCRRNQKRMPEDRKRSKKGRSMGSAANAKQQQKIQNSPTPLTNEAQLIQDLESRVEALEQQLEAYTVDEERNDALQELLLAIYQYLQLGRCCPSPREPVDPIPEFDSIPGLIEADKEPFPDDLWDLVVNQNGNGRWVERPELIEWRNQLNNWPSIETSRFRSLIALARDKTKRRATYGCLASIEGVYEPTGEDPALIMREELGLQYLVDEHGFDIPGVEPSDLGLDLDEDIAPLPPLWPPKLPPEVPDDECCPCG